jgi:hypothetical protein
MEHFLIQLIVFDASLEADSNVGIRRVADGGLAGAGPRADPSRWGPLHIKRTEQIDRVDGSPQAIPVDPDPL